MSRNNRHPIGGGVAFQVALIGGRSRRRCGRASPGHRAPRPGNAAPPRPGPLWSSWRSRQDCRRAAAALGVDGADQAAVAREVHRVQMAGAADDCDGAMHDRCMRAVLHRRRPDRVLHRRRPRRDVQTVLCKNLGDQRVEVGAFDERVLHFEEGLGRLARERAPRCAELRNSRASGRQTGLRQGKATQATKRATVPPRGRLVIW